MTIETEWRDYDVVVIGSGGAGSLAARVAADEGARVLVVSKDPVGCSDTKISEGNATVRAVATDDDSEDNLSENLRMAGGNLPVKEITDAFAKDSQFWSKSKQMIGGVGFVEEAKTALIRQYVSSAEHFVVGFGLNPEEVVRNHRHGDS